MINRSLLNLANVTATPITTGDAGIILKQDGTFQLFSTGEIDGNNMTPEQLAQGEKLFALAVALQVPGVMDTLLMMAADPAIVGENVIAIGRLQ